MLSLKVESCPRCFVSSHWLQMDFVHCNACQGAPSADNRSFWFTNCMHVYCKKCVQKLRLPNGPQAMCVHCKKPCNVVEIGPNMPVKARKLFQPIEKTIKQQRAILKKVLAFNEEQLKSLTEFAKKEREMLMKAAKANMAAKTTITKITKEKTDLEGSVEYHKKRLEDFEKRISDLQSSLNAAKIRSSSGIHAAAAQMFNVTSQSDPTNYSMEFSFNSESPNSFNESRGSFNEFLAGGGGGAPSRPMGSEPATPIGSQMSIGSEMNTPKILGLCKGVRGDNPYLAMWNRTSVERQKKIAAANSGNRNKSMDDYSNGNGKGFMNGTRTGGY